MRTEHEHTKETWSFRLLENLFLHLTRFDADQTFFLSKSMILILVYFQYQADQQESTLTMEIAVMNKNGIHKETCNRDPLI